MWIALVFVILLAILAVLVVILLVRKPGAVPQQPADLQRADEATHPLANRDSTGGWV